jgi:Xaa-Pro dipeptidase
MGEGELVLDLVPRRAGYWGDSCATFAIGEPSAEAVERHRLARERLAVLIEEIRPGVVSGSLDALGRDGLQYPHHTGHGLGSDRHEERASFPVRRHCLRPG